MSGPAPKDSPSDEARAPSTNPEPSMDNLVPTVASPDSSGPGMWLTAASWLPADLLDALQETQPTDGNRALQAALSEGGPLDAMPPGPVLTAFLTEASAPAAPPTSLPSTPIAPDSTAARIASGADLAQLGDNALLGLIRGWRKVASLAAAAELAAVHEFSRRRHDQAKADGAWDSTAMDAADVELGAALTLTNRGTQMLVERAEMQHELPAAATALAAGQIDWPRALVLSTGLTGQEPELARPIGGKH